jgi:uncharacterized repeat protein (TIGR02543 family)
MRIFKKLISLLFIVSTLAHATFNDCAFNFGRAWAGGGGNYAGVDYVTIWLNDEFFNNYWHGDMLRATLPGGAASGATPVFYGYIIAKEAGRQTPPLGDCDVSGGANLCTQGSNFLRTNEAAIIAKYGHYAQQTAGILGANAVVIWLMEPDFYQYSATGGRDQVGGGIPDAQMDDILGRMIAAVQVHLPNAKFSIDISPWAHHSWFDKFVQAGYGTYFNTSGGRTEAATDRIRADAGNEIRWDMAHLKSGGTMSVIADDGYGVGGGSTGHATDWDNVANLNARIEDGVIAITQANPSNSYASTIAAVRPQLNAPPGCGTGPVIPSTYNLAATSAHGPLTFSPPNVGPYAAGTIVTVTISPEPGWIFSGWLGDASGTGLSTTIVLDRNKSVTATFYQEGGNPDFSSGLLENGDFADGSRGWELKTAGEQENGVSGQADSGYYQLTMDWGGTQLENIKLSQGGLTLYAGYTYTLSFKVGAERYSSEGRPLTIRITDGERSYINQEITLSGANWDEDLFTDDVSFDFTPTANTNSATVEFLAGGRYYSDILLDDITLVSPDAPDPLRLLQVRSIPFYLQLGSGLHTLKIPSGHIESLVLRDLKGRPLFNKRVTESYLEISSGELALGIYIAEIKTTNGTFAFRVFHQ